MILKYDYRINIYIYIKKNNKMTDPNILQDSSQQEEISDFAEIQAFDIPSKRRTIITSSSGTTLTSGSTTSVSGGSFSLNYVNTFDQNMYNLNAISTSVLSYTGITGTTGWSGQTGFTGTTGTTTGTVTGSTTGMTATTIVKTISFVNYYILPHSYYKNFSYTQSNSVQYTVSNLSWPIVQDILNESGKNLSEIQQTTGFARPVLKRALLTGEIKIKRYYN